MALFKDKHPELINEYDFKKNASRGIEYDTITCGSNIKAFWTCNTCGGGWEASFAERDRSGCPYCSGHRPLAGFNDLATRIPLLAREWNIEKNGVLTPQDVTFKSNKCVWWKCHKCGHEWQSKVSSRTRTKNPLCPKCHGLTGKRYGKLVALYPTEKRKGTNTVWVFKCDCGNTVERQIGKVSENSSCGCGVRKDISGQRFGRLTAIKSTNERSKGGGMLWLFKCDCGNTIIRPISAVTSGTTSSCGCYRRELSHSLHFIDLVGRKYGMLTPIKTIENTNYDNTLWECKCDCGNTITVTAKALRDGARRSCGCVNNRLYAVYKHVAPDGKVYIGITSQRPKINWTTGSRYTGQSTFYEAIEQYGGLDTFIDSFDHYILLRDGTWFKTDGNMPFDETNLFLYKEACALKAKWIREYNSMLPQYGFNTTTGFGKEFIRNTASRKRLSDTKSGADNRTDWLVYKHTNRINGKVYIGKTCQDPKNRWSAGEGYNRPRIQGKSLGHFYNAIKKYGWENFDHEIIKEGMTRDESSVLEKSLILQYDSTNPEKGYNITKGGEGSVGLKHTESTKMLLGQKAKERILKTGKVNFKGSHHSEKTKKLLREKAIQRLADGQPNPFLGKHHTDETKAILSAQHSKTITQYSLEGKKIKTFNSLQDAALEAGLSNSAISSCALKKTSNCGGYLWRYLEVAQLPADEMQIRSHRNSKRVIKLDNANNTVEIYDSLKSAALANNTNSSTLSSMIKNKKAFNGYYWSYDQNNQYGKTKMVYQLTKDGTFIKAFNSIIEASLETGVNKKNISRALCGKQNTAGGYIWKYNING